MNLTAQEVLDRNFLVIRARLLEIGAALDRVDRAEGPAKDPAEVDPRLATIRRTIDLLSTNEPDRAEKIQLLFSREYQPNWQKELRPAPR